MTPELDPLWPWKHLGPFLAGADTLTRAGVVLAALTVLALPVLLLRPPAGMSRGRLLGAAGLLLVVLLGWVGLRAAGAGPTLLLLVPVALVALTLWAYLGTERATPARVAVVLTLRLAAFALVL